MRDDDGHRSGTRRRDGGCRRRAPALLGRTADRCRDVPVATFVVNVVGSFVLALVAFGGPGGQFALFFGVGACGSFTTYSSFSCETVRLYETDQRARAAVNAVGTLVACLLAVGLGALLV